MYMTISKEFFIEQKMKELGYSFDTHTIDSYSLRIKPHITELTGINVTNGILITDTLNGITITSNNGVQTTDKNYQESVHWHYGNVKFNSSLQDPIFIDIITITPKENA